MTKAAAVLAPQQRLGVQDCNGGIAPLLAELRKAADKAAWAMKPEGKMIAILRNGKAVFSVDRQLNLRHYSNGALIDNLAGKSTADLRQIAKSIV